MTRRKPYVRSMRGWWLGNGHFTRYMLREGTSVFLALYAVVLLAGLFALGNGEAAYGRWLAAMGHPAFVLFHLCVLIAAGYHTYTWFAVSPKAMPAVRLGGAPVPARLIVGGQYAAFAAASLVVLVAAWGA